MDREYSKKLVWEALLDADYRSLYFGHLSSRLQSREQVITVIQGVLSSGTFIALIAKFQLGLVPPILSLLCVLLSIILINFKLGKSATLSASIYSKWSGVKNEYEVLWSEIES